MEDYQAILVKRRASKACISCRSRKVRCDVVLVGTPCTNCRLDLVRCVTTDIDRRRQRRRAVGQDVPDARPLNADAESVAVVVDDELDTAEKGPGPEPPLLRGFDPPQGSAVAADTDSGNRGNGDSYARHVANSAASVSSLLSFTPYPNPTPDSTSTAAVGSSTSRNERPVAENALPSFIQPTPSHLEWEDIQYLNSKGALAVPETTLRNELLLCYVQFVHPFLPLLDLDDFLGAIEGKQGSNPVSLLLFQAVMFAAIQYVDMRHLTAHGLPTRRLARVVFFSRARALCDLSYENDRLTTLQAVLLMTYWHEKPEDPKDVRHWLGVALSLGHTIGLNKQSSSSCSSNPRRQKLWKRIWWCCYIRDSLIAIALRRPMRIQASDTDVPLLELSDFDNQPIISHLSRALENCAALRDTSIRRSLGSLCVALAKLCACLGEVLTLQYTPLPLRTARNLRGNPMDTVPGQRPTDGSALLRHDERLDQWRQVHDSELRRSAIAAQSSAHSSDVLIVHRAVLTGLYLTGISALHRPQILWAPSTPGIIRELFNLSQRRVREAADDIADIYSNLYARDLIRYLPNCGVTCLLPATALHLLDIKAENNITDQDNGQASTRKFRFCMQALNQLRGMYASADFAYSFLDTVANRIESQSSGSGVSTDKEFQLLGSLQPTPPPEATRIVDRMLLAPATAPAPDMSSTQRAPTARSHHEASILQPLSRANHPDIAQVPLVTGSLRGGTSRPLFSGAPRSGISSFSRQMSSPTQVQAQHDDNSGANVDFGALLDMEACLEFFPLSDTFGPNIQPQWMDGVAADGSNTNLNGMDIF